MEYTEVLIEEIMLGISMGPFGSDIKRDCYVPSGVPYLNGSNVQGFKLGESSFIFVPIEKAQKLKKSLAHRGDVIVTHRGTVGQIVYVPNDSMYEEYLISNSQFRVTLDQNRVLPEYFVYYFHTREGQNKLLSNVSQVGVPALARPTSTFRKLSINLPSLADQRYIVDILLSLDRKIELNNRINHNLEEQAMALYKSWFVNFEPFRDRKFVESELGMIPDGWRVGTMDCLLEIKYGKDHKKLGDGLIPVYGSGGFMRYVNQPIYTGESVLIPRKGSLNNVMYVNEAFWTVDTMFYSIQKIQHTVKYCYHILSSLDLSMMNAGSAVPSMTTDILNSIKVIIPDENTLANFDSIMSSLYQRMLYNNNETQELFATRDSLLPKLMSGELSVNKIDC